MIELNSGTIGVGTFPFYPGPELGISRDPKAVYPGLTNC
jgi:hypothetical protein